MTVHEIKHVVQALERPIVQAFVHAFVVYLGVILTGLQVYKTPPESLAVFWQWFWLPNMQALQTAVASLTTSLGIQAAVILRKTP
jgi:hypothetical protein